MEENMAFDGFQFDEDEDMDDEDLGDTSHVSILAPNGDAVSVTTSVGH